MVVKYCQAQNNPYYFWLNNGSGTDPAPGGIGIEIPFTNDDNNGWLAKRFLFDPLKIVITNYIGLQEMLTSENNPEDPNAGVREMPFSGEVYIEREDFMENPPKKWFRLAPGQMVRPKSAYIIKCDEVIKDANSNITELHCTYIPESKSHHDTSGINVRGTLHWVSLKQAVTIEVRLYDRLFKVEDPSSEEARLPDGQGDFKNYINSDSLHVVRTAYAEPSLLKAKFDDRYQFIRKGYFVLDKETSEEKVVFNRTVTLKDSWRATKPHPDLPS